MNRGNDLEKALTGRKNYIYHGNILSERPGPIKECRRIDILHNAFDLPHNCPGICERHRKRHPKKLPWASNGLSYPGRVARRWRVCLAVPGKIIEIREDNLRMGRVSFGQVVKEVSLAFVPKAKLGEYVMIHAGMALEVIDEIAANKVFEALKELEEEGLTGDGWA